MADASTVHWEPKESVLTRSSFNSIVSRKQANVSEMMIKHSSMGRQAEMGPDWQPSALVTIAKARDGAITKKPGIPGLTAPRSSPAPPPVVKTVVPASQTGQYHEEQAPPSELQALRANLAPDEADASAPLSSSMFRSSSSPLIRCQNAMSWASKERRTPTPSKPTPPKLQRSPTPLQAAAVAQLDDGGPGRSRERPRQLPRFEPGLPSPAAESSKQKRWTTPRHSVAEAELSAVPGQRQEPPAEDPRSTVHWGPGEQSLHRDSFNRIVSRTRFDATESMMRLSCMSRQAVLGATWSPPGLVTREIAKKINPAYNSVPFAG